MARGVFTDNASRPALPCQWNKKPGAATLLLQGRGHKREEDEDESSKHSTLRLLEVEVSSQGTSHKAKPSPLPPMPVPPSKPKPMHAKEPPHMRHRAVRPLWGAVVPKLPQVPPTPSGPSVYKENLLGVRPLAAAPKLPPMQPTPSAPSVYKEALDRLTFILATARNDADYAQLLLSFYHSGGPAYGFVLSNWLSLQPANFYFWSRLHHRMRWRSPGRGHKLSLFSYADATIAPALQTRRMLIYVKDWMSELDNQDSMQYRSKWLSARSNRGNFVRFFKIEANCTLMAHYLEDLLSQPEPRDLLAESQEELYRASAAVHAAASARPHDAPPAASQLELVRASAAVQAAKARNAAKMDDSSDEELTPVDLTVKREASTEPSRAGSAVPLRPQPHKVHGQMQLVSPRLGAAAKAPRTLDVPSEGDVEVLSSVHVSNAAVQTPRRAPRNVLAEAQQELLRAGAAVRLAKA